MATFLYNGVELPELPAVVNSHKAATIFIYSSGIYTLEVYSDIVLSQFNYEYSWWIRDGCTYRCGEGYGMSSWTYMFDTPENGFVTGWREGGVVWSNATLLGTDDGTTTYVVIEESEPIPCNTDGLTIEPLPSRRVEVSSWGNTGVIIGAQVRSSSMGVFDVSDEATYTFFGIEPVNAYRDADGQLVVDPTYPLNEIQVNILFNGLLAEIYVSNLSGDSGDNSSGASGGGEGGGTEDGSGEDYEDGSTGSEDKDDWGIIFDDLDNTTDGSWSDDITQEIYVHDSVATMSMYLGMHIGKMIRSQISTKPALPAIVLEVEKITSETYDGETRYLDEEFILLDIYPKTNGTVSVTYGGLTKTITDTSGAEEPNAQKVFFGTYNGVSDEIETPESGTLTIEGDYDAFAVGTFQIVKMGISHCSCITEVVNCGTITKIPAEMFYQCHKITRVTIPETVTSIGQSAFLRCGLTSIVIPDGVKSIGINAFYNCSSLASATIGATSIGAQAFYNCLSLATVVIADGVTSIGNFAFTGCIRLTDIMIPGSVATIGDGSFYNCTVLRSITVSSDNEYYSSDGGVLFNKDKSEICACPSVTGDYVIPDSVTSIGRYAFDSCRELTGITIPHGVTIIGYHSFYGCTGLTNVTIPNSVITIGEFAFCNCTGLTSITIPDSVTTIGTCAFTNCSNLTSVIFENTSGWYVTKTENGDITTGTAVNVTDPKTNATLITDTYDNEDYIWYRA